MDYYRLLRELARDGGVMETKILTKENFWDEMEQKYPKAMKHFKEWIDNYKIEHDWDNLFNEGPIDSWNINSGSNANYKAAPKYHELPVAMQLGIFLEFASATVDQKEFTEEYGTNWMADMISEGLASLEEDDG